MDSVLTPTAILAEYKSAIAGRGVRAPAIRDSSKHTPYYVHSTIAVATDKTPTSTSFSFESQPGREL